MLLSRGAFTLQKRLFNDFWHWVGITLSSPTALTGKEQLVTALGGVMKVLGSLGLAGSLRAAPGSAACSNLALRWLNLHVIVLGKSIKSSSCSSVTPPDDSG